VEGEGQGCIAPTYGLADMRKHLGLRWQSTAATPLSHAQSALKQPVPPGRAKAPSPLHSAGALQDFPAGP